jgi:hypothetical protein
MRKKIITGIAIAGLGLAAFSGASGVAAKGPANGACVAANVKVLGPSGTIGAVAKTGPGVVSGVIQSHLAGNGLVVPC